MALSQKGAGYDYREHIKDPHVKAALDDIASQAAAIRNQGQYGQKGSLQAPSIALTLTVTVAAGIFTATLTAAPNPEGLRFRLQWSTSPNFLAPIEEELATTTWQKQLTGQTLYFRAAPKYLSSPLGAWVYFGGQVNPTALVG